MLPRSGCTAPLAPRVPRPGGASSQAALVLAQQLAHPLTLAIALYLAAILHHLCREALVTQARAEACMTIATAQGLPVQLANATPLWGWALAACGRGAAGITQLQQGLVASQAIGALRDRPYHLALFAEVSAPHSTELLGDAPMLSQ